MTIDRETVIRLAREASEGSSWKPGIGNEYVVEYLQRFAALVLEHGRKPLTDEQIRKWWASENGLEDCRMSKLDDFAQVVRAIEAAHGITNKESSDAE